MNYSISESEIYIFNSSRKLESSTNSESANVLEPYKNNFQESGIIDWACEKDSASAVPNFDDSALASSFLIIPLKLRDITIGIILIRANVSPAEFREEQLSEMLTNAFPAALALDNIRSKNELQKINDKLSTINRQVMDNSRMASFGEIAPAITAEIDNSIKVIYANIGMLETGLGNLPQRIKIIKQHLDTVSQLNKKLNSIAAESLEKKFKTQSVTNIINDVILFSNTQFQRDGIILKTEIESDYNILCSKTQLEQAILSIILFSRDLMLDGGEILIGVYKSRGNKVNMIIRDSSIGLEIEKVKEIFEPILYLQDNEKPRTGLFMARDIIQKHSGKIEIISELSKGITYKITLPVTDKKTE